jgi:hypothetical protein
VGFLLVFPCLLKCKLFRLLGAEVEGRPRYSVVPIHIYSFLFLLGGGLCEAKRTQNTQCIPPRKKVETRSGTLGPVRSTRDAACVVLSYTRSPRDMSGIISGTITWVVYHNRYVVGGGEMKLQMGQRSFCV